MEGQYIEFRKTRDFSNKVNVTFEFIKQNYKVLFKSILYIAGPPILIGALMMGSIVGDIANLQASSASGDFSGIFTVNFLAQLGLAFAFLFTMMVASTSTIHNLLLVYEERKGEGIEVYHVWDKVKATLGSYFVTGILLTILIMIVYVAMAIPVAVLGSISGWLVFLGFLIFVFGFFYIFVNLALVFPVRAFERVGFFAAVGRSFRLIQGKWWSTFGLGLIMTLIAMIISYVLALPYSIITNLTLLHSLDGSVSSPPSTGMQIILTVFICISYLGQAVLSSLPLIGITYQYFNLVEMKEARGLMSQIQTFGAPVKGSTAEEGDEF